MLAGKSLLFSSSPFPESEQIDKSAKKCACGSRAAWKSCKHRLCASCCRDIAFTKQGTVCSYHCEKRRLFLNSKAHDAQELKNYQISEGARLTGASSKTSYSELMAVDQEENANQTRVKRKRSSSCMPGETRVYRCRKCNQIKKGHTCPFK